MENFEQKIINAVNEKLNDGTVEKLVSQYIEKGVSDALSSLFSYSGEGKKLIEKKLNETIVPVIEEHDFNQYLTKLDTVLTEIVNATNLVDNKEILENFKGLMKEPETKEIKLSEIFKQYCKHVAENIDTSGLEACCEDGEPYYEHVTAQMEVVTEDLIWYTRDNYRIVKFTCEEDEKLNCRIALYKYDDESVWRFRAGKDSVDVNSLRWMKGFEIFLLVLNRAWVKVIIDKEYDCDDDIEPEKNPEWDLR